MTVKEDCINLITKYTGHPYVKLTVRGNKAIMYSMRVAKKFNQKEDIMIPDQGGWLTYKQSPKKVKQLIKEIKTDYGVINLEDLEKHISLNKSTAFIYSNPAGYYADQPMKGIYDLCKGSALVIKDVSGGIGYPELCDGNYADMMVGSFGKWKIVNAGKGGFISFNSKEMFDASQEDELKESELNDLKNKLLRIDERITMFRKYCAKIKSDLNGYEILHPEGIGVNVIIKFKNEFEKNKIIEYCVNNSYDFTECPKYIRVYENAISIEVKRL